MIKIESSIGPGCTKECMIQMGTKWMEMVCSNEEQLTGFNLLLQWWAVGAKNMYMKYLIQSGLLSREMLIKCTWGP